MLKSPSPFAVYFFFFRCFAFPFTGPLLCISQYATVHLSLTCRPGRCRLTMLAYPQVQISMLTLWPRIAPRLGVGVGRREPFSLTVTRLLAGLALGGMLMGRR